MINLVSYFTSEAFEKELKEYVSKAVIAVAEKHKYLTHFGFTKDSSKSETTHSKEAA